MIIAFCTECAEPYTKIDGTHYVCDQGHHFYNNPHAAVAVVLYNDSGEILFSKRAHEPAKGKYDLPGGFCEFNEDPFETAEREIREETGMTIDNLELVTAYPGLYQPNNSVCDLVVVTHTHTGTPTPDDDSEALEWKPLSFINDATFNPNYHGLDDKLHEIITSRVK